MAEDFAMPPHPPAQLPSSVHFHGQRLQDFRSKTQPGALRGFNTLALNQI